MGAVSRATTAIEPPPRVKHALAGARARRRRASPPPAATRRRCREAVPLTPRPPSSSRAQYLSSPVTEKHTAEGETGHGAYGISAQQGWRRSMEDAHFAVQLDASTSLFAVFDGHGGHEVAEFCAHHLPGELRAAAAFRAGDFAAALRETFHAMDDQMRTEAGLGELARLRREASAAEENGGGAAGDGKEGEFNVLSKLLALQRMIGPGAPGAPLGGDDAPARAVAPAPAAGGELAEGDSPRAPRSPLARVQAGCTAVVALLHERELFVANAGDSRAVLCRAGAAVPLSEDHKPASARERERIVAAGGFLSDVAGVCRVNGNLNLSRAIGDHRYKGNADLAPAAQIITAEPDVERVAITPEDRFLVLACDGVWDVMSNEEVVVFVGKQLDAGASPTAAASALLDACLASDPRETRGVGCDNQTAVIIVFKDGGAALEGGGVGAEPAAA
jgi:protein phosphatase 1G